MEKKMNVTETELNKLVENVATAMQKDSYKWKKSWIEAGSPINYSTGEAYSGVNFLSLNFAMIDKGYKNNQWLTFKQLKTLGGDIKNNSWNYIYKFGRINVVDDNKKPVVDSKGKQKSRNYFRCFVVYNIENTTLEAKVIEKKSTQYSVDEIEAFIDRVNNNDVRIKTDSTNGCYYSPSYDWVHMVNKSNFIDTKDANATEHYYSVLFHELVHATGHQKRLNRFENTKSMKFLEGKSHYAYEELVAELGSMLFASKYNLSVESTVREDHIAYLQSWIKALRSEDGTKLLTSAAAKAAAAFKYYHQSQL
jgi:antirestriction protein ArdC